MKKYFFILLLLVLSFSSLIACEENGLQSRDIPATEYFLNISTIGEGTTNPGVGGYSYEQETTVNLTAEAVQGWIFKEWLIIKDRGEIIKTEQSIFVEVDTVVSVMAVFEEETQTGDGELPILFVSHSHKMIINSSFQREVFLTFPQASEIGAYSYGLEFSVDGVNWDSYKENGSPKTTYFTYFSIEPDDNYYYRLKINGGIKNGYTSNQVYIPISYVPLCFIGAGITYQLHSESPHIIADFDYFALDSEDNINYDQYISYQWYLLNLDTYQLQIIPEANNVILYLPDEGIDMNFDYVCQATFNVNEEFGGFFRIQAFINDAL